jgi:hypothetical protein
MQRGEKKRNLKNMLFDISTCKQKQIKIQRKSRDYISILKPQLQPMSSGSTHQQIHACMRSVEAREMYPSQCRNIVQEHRGEATTWELNCGIAALLCSASSFHGNSGMQGFNFQSPKTRVEEERRRAVRGRVVSI